MARDQKFMLARGYYFVPRPLAIASETSLVPRLLHRKTGREPGRFDHVPRDVRAWFCAWLSDRLPIAIFDFVYSIGLYVWLGLELYT